MNMYAEALISQSVCNLSGLAHSLAGFVTQIRQEPECTGTDYVNKHPVVRLLLEQMVYLNCYGSIDHSESYTRAYAICKEKADVLYQGA